jgi:exodeoxyribonuclease-1
MVTAISYHPDYADRAIVFNLDQDPEILLELEVDELKTLVFSKKVDLPKGIDKLELSELVFNKSPMFVCSPNHDSFKLSPILVEKLKLDIDKYMKNLSFIQKNQKQIEDKVQSIYKQNLQREPSRDIDQSLYDGFISNKDKAICNEIQKLTINEIGQLNPNFEDRKLLKLFLNFKARNYPELLSDDEQEEWFEIVQSRVQNGENGFLSFDSFENSLDNLKNSNPEKDKLWQDLEAYAQTFL